MPKNRKHRVSPKFLVDVVITTGGRWDMLRSCLAALAEQTHKPNIILLDNASVMEERLQNESLFENVTTKRLQQPLGFPDANNTAARMGSAPLILFLNDDCVLTRDAIDQMVRTMDDKSIGICGAKLLFPLNSTSPIRPAGKVQHIGIGLGIRGETFHPMSGWSSDNPRCNISRDVFAVTGACLMVRRSLFSKLNGFDPAYGAGTYEDVDICVKARSMGQRVFVNVNALGYHYTGATSEKNKTGFPLQMNSNIFKSRWMNTPYMAWDAFSYY